MLEGRGNEDCIDKREAKKNYMCYSYTAVSMYVQLYTLLIEILAQYILFNSARHIRLLQ